MGRGHERGIADGREFLIIEAWNRAGNPNAQMRLGKSVKKYPGPVIVKKKGNERYELYWARGRRDGEKRRGVGGPQCSPLSVNRGRRPIPSPPPRARRSPAEVPSVGGTDVMMLGGHRCSGGRGPSGEPDITIGGEAPRGRDRPGRGAGGGGDHSAASRSVRRRKTTPNEESGIATGMQ